MAFRIWSRHFPGTKAEYVLTYGTLPARARPAAIPTMLASAIPTLKKRSGNLSPKRLVLIETDVSAPITTILVSRSPSSRRASASASRIDASWTSTWCEAPASYYSPQLLGLLGQTQHHLF